MLSNFCAVIVFLVLNVFVVMAQQTEIVYNLAKIGSANEKISANCRNDLEHVVNSINKREIWAMKLLDASGKFGSGFIWGNNYLLGDQSGCTLVNKPIHITQTRHLNPLNPTNLITERSPFPVKYRMVYIRHTSQLQMDFVIYDRKILHLGLCFPQSCRDADTMILAQHYFYKYEYIGRELIGNNITVLRTKTLQLRPDFWNDKFVKMLTWITIFSVINIIIGTIYIHNVQQNRLKMLKKTDDDKPVKAGIVERWFSSFSLIQNTKTIFNLKIGDDSIDIVHGIRALGMFWLIVGHVIYFSAKSVDNFEISMKFGDIWYYQPLITNFLGVDTFIVLSAFLLSFLHFQRLEKMKKENDVALITRAIIFRYLKLTPPHIVVILLTYTITVYLGDTTPFEMLEDYEKNCHERFWPNLLYINNLFPVKDSCLIWAWYMANDFQSYVLAFIVLVVFTRNQKLGISLGFGISLVSMAVSMYFAVKVKFSFAIDNCISTVDVMYTPTWNRLAAYFVAVIGGWYFSKEKGQLRLSKFYIAMGWIIAEIIFFGTIFLHLYKEYNPIMAILYSGFGRILWSVGTCWVLIACASNNGGFLTKIFASKIWIPFSRMSFACYIINPIVITTVFMLSETAYHYNIWLYIVESVGFIALCFSASYVMMVVYEMPCNMLIRTFIEKKK